MIKQLIFATAILGSGISSVEAAPAVKLTPSSSTVQVGSSFTMDIDISSVIDLYYWEIDLGFGPTNLVGATSQGTGSFFGGLDLFVPGAVNNLAGTVTGVASTLFGLSGVDGGGTLAKFTFSALSTGVANFSFARVLLGNSNLDPIFISNSDWIPGQVTIVPEPSAALLTLLGAATTMAAVSRRRRRRTV